MLKKASKILHNSSNTQAVLLVWLLGLINYYYLINYSPNQKSTCSIMCLPGSSDGKESAHNAKTRLWSLGWEDPLGKEMTTHSSILAWRIPQKEEPGGLPSMKLQRVGHDWVTNNPCTILGLQLANESSWGFSASTTT